MRRTERTALVSSREQDGQMGVEVMPAVEVGVDDGVDDLEDAYVKIVGRSCLNLIAVRKLD